MWYTSHQLNWKKNSWFFAVYNFAINFQPLPTWSPHLHKYPFRIFLFSFWRRLLLLLAHKSLWILGTAHETHYLICWSLFRTNFAHFLVLLCFAFTFLNARFYPFFVSGIPLSWRPSQSKTNQYSLYCVILLCAEYSFKRKVCCCAIFLKLHQIINWVDALTKINSLH